MTASSEVTREMALYVSEAFYAYEAVRDARDEALCRLGEVEEQRDQAQRVAASLEAEVAKVRALHAPHTPAGKSEAVCHRCSIGQLAWVLWPCQTARAVYLT
jgi:hypothetical protein